MADHDDRSMAQAASAHIPAMKPMKSHNVVTQRGKVINFNMIPGVMGATSLSGTRDHPSTSARDDRVRGYQPVVPEAFKLRKLRVPHYQSFAKQHMMLKTINNINN